MAARTRWDDVPWRETDWKVTIENEDGTVDVFDNASRKVSAERWRVFEGQTMSVVEQLSVLGRVAQADEVRTSLKAVGQLMESVLKGQVAADQDLGRARLRLLSAIVSGRTDLSRDELIAFVGAASMPLAALLARSTSLRAHPVHPDELIALAIGFLHPLLRRDRIKKRELGGYRLFLRDAPSALAVEAELNRLYAIAAADPRDLPILFRSHGLAKDRLIHKAHVWVDAMRKIAEAFQQIGYQCAICYGPLLGAVRHDGFIYHDDDADMAILLKKSAVGAFRLELDELTASLSENGFDVSYLNLGFLKVAPAGTDQIVDVFPIIEDGDQLFMHMQGLKMRAVPRAVLLPFGPLDFYGETFLAPADPPAFLQERYGADWRTPKRAIVGRWVAADNLGPQT